MEELLLPDGYALMLRKPVLVESGQTYWVDGDWLVVEDAGGQQQRFAGDLEPRCY